MGKSNKKGNDVKTALATAPKCTCDHPFTCTCGNRPPRPSKGHKWDPESQTWGGKGHKQKGASGQIALKSQEARTTDVGKTQVAQWQCLPSQLLEEVCKRQKRICPKYKNIDKAKGKFRYRVKLPDGKDTQKDLFFVPASSVVNEEQAKEEACLLALLQLTPTLPHERKLPDPYKLTWLNAINALKTASKDVSNEASVTSGSALTRVAKPSAISTQPSPGCAQASANLIRGFQAHIQNGKVNKVVRLSCRMQ
jgi:hypothetical protein